LWFNIINWGMQNMKSQNSSRSVLILSFLGIVLGLCTQTPAAAAELVWTGDFETGDFSQYKDHLYEGGVRAVKKLVKSPVRAGRYATELTILDIEAKHERSRAELITQMPSGGTMNFKWDGPEYWLGFSFLFKEPTASTSTFFQIHAPNEPKGDACDFAGNAFTIGGSGADSNDGITKEIIIRVIEDGGVSAGKGSGSNNKVVYRYPFPIDEWQDYVVNFKLSTRGDGFYKVWKNGKAVYSKSGITNVNYRDSCGNWIPEKQRMHNGGHIGIYASGTLGFRRVFYDEVRIAEGSDGFKLVALSDHDTSDRATEDAIPKPPIVVDNQ
jgi:hypothetical protein